MNYELARIGKGKNPRAKNINDLRKDDHKTLQQAALACLVNDYNAALDIIEHCIKMDYEDRYTIEGWLVFEKLYDNDRYKKLLALE